MALEVENKTAIICSAKIYLYLELFVPCRSELICIFSARQHEHIHRAHYMLSAIRLSVHLTDGSVKMVEVTTEYIR